MRTWRAIFATRRRRLDGKLAGALQKAKVAMRQNNKHADTINNVVLVLWFQAPEIIRDLKPVVGKYRDERKTRRVTHDSLVSEWKSLNRQAAQRSLPSGEIAV